jgi:hypothetical protein
MLDVRISFLEDSQGNFTSFAFSGLETYATGINDSEQIVGIYFPSGTNSSVGYIGTLSPNSVPEPSTVNLAAAGYMALAAYSIRRKVRSKAALKLSIRFKE